MDLPKSLHQVNFEPKVAQGQIPNVLEDLDKKIGQLEGYVTDISALLITPKPEPPRGACDSMPVETSPTLVRQLVTAKARVADVVSQLEEIRGILNDQLGLNTKLV